MQISKIFSAIIFLIVIGAFSSTSAQDRFSINTSLTAVGGNLSDGSHNIAYYLYGGLRYQAQDYYLSLSLPLVFNSSGSFTQLGGMYIPNGNGNDTGGGMHGSGGQGSLNAGGIGVASFTYSYNNWNLVELVVDIDNDAAELKFNGTSIFTWPWSAGVSGNGSQLKLSAIDFFGETDQYQMYVDDFTFTDLLFVSVEDSNEVNVNTPVTYGLDQNYPNPFNPITTIRFYIPVSGYVKLTLFNLLGQELKTLVNEFKESGMHTIDFNAQDLVSGIYIYKLESSGFVQLRKMTLLK